MQDGEGGEDMRAAYTTTAPPLSKLWGMPTAPFFQGQPASVTARPPFFPPLLAPPRVGTEAAARRGRGWVGVRKSGARAWGIWLAAWEQRQRRCVWWPCGGVAVCCMVVYTQLVVGARTL